MALVLLNTKISCNLEKYWDSYNIKVCADGAFNRLNAYNLQHNTNYTPDVVIGDMDSYLGTDKNIKLIKIEDQDSTDFTKCIRYLEDIGVNEVTVIGGYGGRLDHQCANLQTIINSRCIIKMIDRTNYTCKVLPGHNKFISNGYCGLIPLSKSKVRTRGFKWEVDGELNFEELISTSNHAIGEVEVSLEYGSCLFWTVNTL